MLKKYAFLAFILLAFASCTVGQTFTFECMCEHVSGANCDICNTSVISRSFHGLLIKRNGTPYRWIDEPYTIRQLNGEVVQIVEQIPNPDQIQIAKFQTQFATMAGFLDSVTCFCNLGGAMDTVVVDIPIIGNGTPGSPLTIGQFGADTTSYLNWNGTHWYPAHIQLTDIEVNLPYYTGDDAALAAGLVPGDPYLLECENDYTLPAGIFKVVKICGFDCSFALRYFRSDAYAVAGGIPIGREYVLDEDNFFGVLYGFLKVVTADTITDGTLLCSVSVPAYQNDVSALIGGALFGDHYTMTTDNTYGAPVGMVRAVSSVESTSADAPGCCDLADRLPFFDNDAAATTGGLSTGNYYYLTLTNTLGWPYGTKKRIP